MRFMLWMTLAFSTLWAQKIEDFIKVYDKNGDGKVVLKEYTGDQATFYRYDRDENGELVAKELTKEGQSNDELIKTFDRNANKMIEKTEFPGSPEDFARYDKNKDNVIDENEAKTTLAGRNGRMGQDESPFDQQDEDKNGYLDKKETKLTRKEFKKFDKNKDNFISREESLVLAETLQEKQEKTAAKNRGGKRRPQNANEFMARWDKDKDDLISQEELNEGPKHLLPQMDMNEDKKISKDEAERYFRVQSALGFMEKYDRNEDGIVTQEEFQGPSILFERCDFNSDGVITKADRVDRR